MTVPLILAMRLDVFLFENGYAHSRSFAQSLIKNGKIKVDGKIVTKPSLDIVTESQIEVSEDTVYVSRGAYKLEGAVKAFAVKICERYCIDVGASSGGFTDYLLKNGATHVIAVDSGFGQLAESLREDSRVTSIENYNARYMRGHDFAYSPDLAVMDVSFISATYIIPALYDVLSDRADFICLIKPQFEVGRGGIGKGGIVKDKSLRDKAVKDVVDFATGCGFSFCGLIESPITGGDGNVEFLAHFRKEVVL